jgi:hypothetical protein
MTAFQRIPEVPPTRPVVTYCLCESEASSSRVALWLSQAGYRNVSVLVIGPVGTRFRRALSFVGPERQHRRALRGAAGETGAQGHRVGPGDGVRGGLKAGDR